MLIVAIRDEWEGRIRPSEGECTLRRTYRVSSCRKRFDYAARRSETTGT